MPAYQNLSEHLLTDMTEGNLEDLLRYCDRNSMAHSREVRLPFLSHELCEFVFKLPSEYKIKDGWSKWIQRISLESFLPPQITWRKDKIGYEPPQTQWMQNTAFKDLIIHSKEMLFKEKIITREEAEKKPGTVSATSRGDNSWIYLMAGKLL
jgi:asparagine synthase (glutamine-hydrolysing)